MRLIDADRLIEILNDWWFKVIPSTYEPKEVKAILKTTANVIENCIDIVNDRPTAYDIVRCNECNNYSENIIWETESRPQYFCTKNNHYCKDDWYCAGGERRQKGGK